MAGPEGEVVGIDGCQLIVQKCNVVDQTEILDRIHMWHGSRVDSKTRKRPDSGSLPLGDGGFNLRRPHQIGLVGSGRTFGIGNLDVVVRASDLVLGAIAATFEY
jgi:hypothetical protein